MAGFRPFWPAAGFSPDFVIDKVNTSGSFTATTDFSTDYYITDNFPNCQSTLNIAPRNCSGVSVIETNNQGSGEAYVLAGAYSAYDGTNTAGSVFFSTLDQNGNIINTVSWNFGGGSVGKAIVRESAANPGQYYICANTNYQSDLFVAKVNAAGTQLWAWTYNVGSSWFEGRDLIESPYNSGDLVVVGRVDAFPSTPTAADCFFMILNANNGTVTSSQYYNFLGWDSDDWFSSIEPAVSSFSAQGYIIGGRCYGPTAPSSVTPRPTNQRYEQLMCKLDDQGNIIWDALIKSAAWTGSLNSSTSEVIGVYERFNSGTQEYEYYGVSGYELNPAAAAPQSTLMVYKLNTAGLIGTLTPTEFRYTQGSPHHPISYIGHAAITGIETGGGADDGIQAYGSAGRGTHYFVKAYFNGTSGCNEVITDIDSVFQGLNAVGSLTIQTTAQSQCNALTITTNTPGTSPNVSCSSPTVTGGSNAKVNAQNISAYSIESMEYSDLIVYPNPVKDKLNIKFYSSNDGKNKLLVRLYDLQGRIIVTANSIRDSEGNFQIDFSQHKITSGLYRLEIVDVADRNSLQMKVVFDPF